MGKVAALWGVAGVTALLSFAIYRLAQISLDSFRFGYEWHHWVVLAANAVFMCYTEGYRGFQLAFSPRAAARARYIRDYSTPFQRLLAPLFCMGYFHTSKRRLISVYVLTGAILVLIVVFNQLSQPWRGLMDVGVVCGLVWGVVTFLRYAFLALGQGEFSHSPELPPESSRRASVKRP